MIISCEICGKSFNRKPKYIKRSNHHYCSKKCMGVGMRGHDRRWRNKKDIRVDIICIECNKTFRVLPSQYKRKFCNSVCKKQYEESKRKYCTFCNKKIVGKIKGDFCCGTCEKQSWRQGLIGQIINGYEIIKFNKSDRSFTIKCENGHHPINSIIKENLIMDSTNNIKCRICERRNEYLKVKCSICDVDLTILPYDSNRNKTGNYFCPKCNKNRIKNVRVGHISGKCFAKIKKGAKDRDILEFNIDQNYISDLYDQQNGKCVYSGMDIWFGKTSWEEQHGGTTASLDRINSDLGYVPGNVQWTHKDINLLKNDLTEKDFLRYVKAIVEFKKFKENNKIQKLEDYEPENNMFKFKGYREISGSYWRGVQTGAKARNIIFDLNIEDVWKLYLNQGGLCHYSGLPIKFDIYARNKPANEHSQNCSIDRTDSNKGYTIDNIKISHQDINLMKWDFSEDYFLELCEKVYWNMGLDKLEKKIYIDSLGNTFCFAKRR